MLKKHVVFSFIALRFLVMHGIINIKIRSVVYGVDLDEKEVFNMGSNCYCRCFFA